MRFAALGVALALTCACAATSSPIKSNGTYGSEARCEQYIKTLLRSPASAKFSGETAVDNGDRTWGVAGDVDSQNGFGALLRSRWTCIASDGGNDTWGIVSGSVLPQ